MFEIVQFTYKRHLIKDFPKFDKNIKNVRDIAHNEL